jgi:hypothetical protein
MMPTRTNSIPRSLEAVTHMAKFWQYLEGQTKVNEAVFRSLNMLENFAYFKKLLKTIRNFTIFCIECNKF